MWRTNSTYIDMALDRGRHNFSSGWTGSMLGRYAVNGVNAVIGSRRCGEVGEVAPSGVDFRPLSSEANHA